MVLSHKIPVTDIGNPLTEDAQWAKVRHICEVLPIILKIAHIDCQIGLARGCVAQNSLGFVRHLV